MGQDQIWISELAEITGVSTRTIRYYIEEGLLPQPETRGKYAIFSQEYVDRLRLIKTLKKTFLPLKEIKLRLDKLSAEQVHQLAHQFELHPGQDFARLDTYANLDTSVSSETTVHEGKADYLVRGTRNTSPSSTHTPPSSAAKIPASQAERVRALPKPDEESWTRVTLLPGMELWIREEAQQKDRVKIQQLILYARDLFTSLDEKPAGQAVDPD